MELKKNKILTISLIIAFSFLVLKRVRDRLAKDKKQDFSSFFSLDEKQRMELMDYGVTRDIKQEIILYDNSPYVSKLKEIVNFLFKKDIIEVNTFYDKDFYNILTTIFKGTDIITKPNIGAIDKGFISNIYNIVSKLKHKQTMPGISFNKPARGQYIEKGDKSIEVSKLKEILNYFYNDRRFDITSTYDKKLYRAVKILFEGTSILKDKLSGGVNIRFINNIYIVIHNIINLKNN
jgi:hypothetical protein